jgi:hypothetical protein
MADGMDRAATTAGMSKRAATEEQAQGVGADIRGDELHPTNLYLISLSQI